MFSVQYEDGDVEDMDTKEYNFAYALHLKREVRDLEEDLQGNSDASGDSEGTNTYWRPSKVSLKTCFYFVIFVACCTFTFLSQSIVFLLIFLLFSVRRILK